MNDKCYKYLQDILDAAVDINSFIDGKTYADFDSSALIQRAVEREFEIVGEALNRISRIDEELFDSIPDAGRIIGFRNIIAHGYDILESKIIWSAITENLPALVKAVLKQIG